MKKITFLLLFLSSFVYSQSAVQGTTDEEYNYITKGYSIALSSGLDLKQGYKLKDLFSINEGTYNFDFKIFYREKERNLAGIMVKTTSKFWGNVYYFCIPVNNPDLMQKYGASLDSWDRDILLSYSKVMSSVGIAYINESVNTALKN